MSTSLGRHVQSDMRVSYLNEFVLVGQTVRVESQRQLHQIQEYWIRKYQPLYCLKKIKAHGKTQSRAQAGARRYMLQGCCMYVCFCSMCRTQAVNRESAHNTQAVNRETSRHTNSRCTMCYWNTMAGFSHDGRTNRCTKYWPVCTYNTRRHKPPMEGKSSEA